MYQKYNEAQKKETTYHIRSLILTIICLVFIILAISSKDYKVVFCFFLAFFLIIYYVDCCIASTPKYLKNEFESLEFGDLLRRVKEEKPTLDIHITCYHWETHHHHERYKDANGNTQTRTRTEQKKVITFTDSQPFIFNEYHDETGEIYGLEGDQLIRLKVHKEYTFCDPQTAARFAQQKADFINMNRFRDVIIEEHEEFNIPFHKENVLVRQGNASKPFCLDVGFYGLFSFVLMSWPYRMWTECVTTGKEIRVIKRIGRDPNAPTFGVPIMPVNPMPVYVNPMPVFVPVQNNNPFGNMPPQPVYQEPVYVPPPVYQEPVYIPPPTNTGFIPYGPDFHNQNNY